jgi:hypothetical protein
MHEGDDPKSSGLANWFLRPALHSNPPKLPKTRVRFSGYNWRSLAPLGGTSCGKRHYILLAGLKTAKAIQPAPANAAP